MRLVAVEWLDAADETEVNIKSITNTRDYLVRRTTYGVLYHEDEYGVVIMRDVDEDGDAEITAIPKQMLVEIKESG